MSVYYDMLKKINYFICCFFLSFLLVNEESIASDESRLLNVNFVVLTNKTNISNNIDLKQLKNEIYILNKYFITKNRDKIFDFKFKSAFFYKDIDGSQCEFLKYGDIKEYDSIEASELYWKCKDKRIRDPFAINFYIVDSYSKKKGYKSITSHGKNAGNHPFVLIDWQRLNHKVQSPEEHEMGHAFGLTHVCNPNAKITTETNIMASRENCKGSGGLRNVGFNDSQQKIINTTYRKIMRRFNSNKRILED